MRNKSTRYRRKINITCDRNCKSMCTKKAHCAEAFHLINELTSSRGTCEKSDAKIQQADVQTHMHRENKSKRALDLNSGIPFWRKSAA
jgi:hypothetical protein